MRISIYALPQLICFILFLFLGFIVFFNNKKSIANKMFFYVCLYFAWWQLTSLCMLGTYSYNLADFFSRFGYTGIVFLPTVIYHFVLKILGISDSREKLFLKISYYIVIFYIFLIIFTDYFLNGLWTYHFGFFSKGSYGHLLYVIHTVVVSYRSIFLSYKKQKKYKNGTENYKNAKYLLISLLLISFSGLDFMSNYGYPYYPLSFIFLFLSVVSFAYAIIRHQFMDIKLILKKTTVYVISFLLDLFVFLVLFSVLNNYINLYLNLIFTLLISLYIFNNIYLKVSYYANNYFFSSLYNPQELIGKITKDIKSTLEIEKIYQSIYDHLSKAMHFKSFAILKFDETKKIYKIDKIYKNDVKFDTEEFVQDEILYENYIKKGKVIIVDELKNEKEVSDKVKNTVKILKKKQVHVLVPLNTNDKTIGLIAIGQKESKDSYNSEDIKVFEIISHHTAIAIENALLYKNLEQKVEERTKEIKDLQEEQKRMMVDISHNLQTPLAVMKTELDNLKYNSAGSENLKSFEYSIDKVTKFIYDLLKLSELEREQGKIALHDLDFSDLVLEQAEYFEVVAGNQDIKVEHEIEEEIRIRGDKNKLEDLMQNLVSNAIKYIGEGDLIKITLKKVDDKIILTIKDNGIGISEENQKRIFDRFVRIKDKDTEKIKGTGLGLAIVKKIVVMHGGEIRINSEKGEGTEFVVEF